MRIRRRYRIRSGRALAASVAAGGLLLAACGGGGDSGVASLGDRAARAGDRPTDAAATEEEMLDYTECLRGQGLDIEDPVIDANGNVSFGRLVEEGPGHSQQFEAAQEACGEPPGGGFADHGGADQAEHDDAQLELAQCMRDQGFDMPDPDVSGDDVDAEHVDENDPEFQEAYGECRDALSAPRDGENLPSGGG